MDAWNVILVILSILSLLTTALIGWQIFSVIKIEQIKKSVKQTEKRNLQSMLKSQYLSSRAMASYYYTYINNDKYDITDWNYYFIDETISMINYLLALDKTNDANKEVNALISTIKHDKIYIERKNKADLLSRINDLRGKIEDTLYSALILEIEHIND